MLGLWCSHAGVCQYSTLTSYEESTPGFLGQILATLLFSALQYSPILFSALLFPPKTLSPKTLSWVRRTGLCIMSSDNIWLDENILSWQYYNWQNKELDEKTVFHRSSVLLVLNEQKVQSRIKMNVSVFSRPTGKKQCWRRILMGSGVHFAIGVFRGVVQGKSFQGMYQLGMYIKVFNGFYLCLLCWGHPCAVKY